MSDTHDDVAMAAEAVRVLTAEGAERLIHCGDVGGKRVIDQLVGTGATEVVFVWGNNDYERDELGRYAEGLGLKCAGVFADLEFGAKRGAMMHGDDLRLRRRVLDGQQYEYLFLGHTHVRQDEAAGRTRVINPGALYRATMKSVAVLDTERDELRFIPIARRAGV